MATTITPPQPILVVTFQVDDVLGSVTLTTTRGLRVYYVGGQKNGAGAVGGGTARLFNGAAPITNAIGVDALADQTVFSAGTIDDASNVVASGGSLTLTTAVGGTPACSVHVECLPA